MVAAAVAVPLASGAGAPIVYGTSLTLSGVVPSARAGQTVTMFARPFGRAKFSRVGSTATTAGGKWQYRARPAIETTYLAAWGGTTTQKLVVSVSPRLDLDLRHGVLHVTARTSRSLNGRALFVQQRRAGGVWRGVRRLVLDASSNAQARFTALLGRSELRLYMPQSEAGAGYAAGYSGVLVFTRT